MVVQQQTPLGVYPEEHIRGAVPVRYKFINNLKIIRKKGIKNDRAIEYQTGESNEYKSF